MNRKTFLKTLAAGIGATALPMKLTALQSLAEGNPTPLMPALFLGHGSPMNAIEENEFVRGFRQISAEIAPPRAILCISAHWETRGTKVTAMPQPRTIHDFGGFPQALFDVQYPAPGSPELAAEAQQAAPSADIHLDHQWGLDHGAWSVLKHLYPQANVPVVQLSLDRTKPPAYHYALAAELAQLRSKGVLVVGSGNLVHNLRMAAWDRLHEPYAYDWAQEASDSMNRWILDGNHQALIHYAQQGKALQLAIPTPEHFLPLLYLLGMQRREEAPLLFNNKPLAGSLAMTSVKIG